MAISAATEFEVRTTGSDTNGGGFVNGATGTDRSQQDAAQFTYTDLVIGGTNTQLTSAANPFTSAEVGNLLNITSGTGFTTGRYQVVSVSSGVATMDRAVGTASSTGGNGKLGGALLTISTCFNAAVSGNTCWVKSGTYTVTSTILLNHGSTAMPSFSGYLRFIGFGSTHDDNGTKPLITTATNSTKLFTVQQAVNQTFLYFTNLSMSNTATTREDGLYSNFADTRLYLTNCILDGFVNGISPAWYSIFTDGVEIKNCTGRAISNRCRLWLCNSYFHNNADALATIYGAGGYPQFSMIRCIVSGGSSVGVYVDGISTGADEQPLFYGNTITGNTTSGITLICSAGVLAAFLIDNIIYGNGGYGVTGTSGALVMARNNAWGSNTSGKSNGVKFATLSGDVTLTATPFTNSASGDYSLNSSAGGGALCKGTGYPGVFPGGTSTGISDIGAVGSGTGGSSGSGSGSYGFIG